MTMTTETLNLLESRQVQLAKRPEGVPKPADFEIVTTELQPLCEGEFLVRNEWMSVDPYMRGRMKEGSSYVNAFQLGQPLEGGCTGRVIESRNAHFVEGEYVLANFGWRELWKSSGEGVSKIDVDPAPRNLFKIIGERIRMQGFIVRDHMADFDEFTRDMSSWIKSQKIIWQETVTTGLEQSPQAFIGLFDGSNLGKALVRIG
jgi:NADPH-dependent curcumin reductase CurA